MWMNKIETSCNKPIPEIFSRVLFNKCFIDSGVFSLPFSLVMGILLSQGSYRELEYLQTYKSAAKTTIMLRVLVFGLIAGTITLPFIIAVPYMNQYSIYAMFFLRYNIPLFVAGFLCIRCFPCIAKMLNIQIQGELLLHDGNTNNQ